MSGPAARIPPFEPGEHPVGSGTVHSLIADPVVAVVGFDGSDPSARALVTAARWLQDRSGWLEVVYVAHVPAAVPIYPAALGELTESFGDIERQLERQVADQLRSFQALWHFRRRDGVVGHELLAVADELRRQNGQHATIVLVVGGSERKYHRLVGSVASHLERVDRFPVVVVP